MTLQENQIELDEASCNYWHMAALIFLVFDHLLTLDTEVKCLWKRPSNISGYLFFLHRYISPLLSVFAFDLDLPMRYSYIAHFGTYYHQSGHSQESDTCLTQLDTASSIRQAVAWEMLLVYDILLFVLAFHHAIKTRNELRILRNRVSLQVILLRDVGHSNHYLDQYHVTGQSGEHFDLLWLYERRFITSCEQAVDVGIYASQFTTQLDQQVETHITFARRQNVNRSATDTENLAIGLE
ncbi:hypothetical protein D9758_012202 [Tetrapyrgos nigripes]|uniref:DUF6533 domain-containing protein n=1 Tax=Tetrapyrgos nigripes TaxID=182062 RepID=A0A8H5FKU1_9AGAR|nr:hypothetical protein D9758_012202 [Tetrapyrgos nigripes]